MGRYSDMLGKRLRNPLPQTTVAAITEGLAAREKAALKGKFDGNCNRTACQRSIKWGNWWNSSTRAYYCADCAHDINYWSNRDDGIIICTAVTDPNDQPAFPTRKAA